MRYPACEKLEIIRLVEQSHLPVRRTLAKLGILPATFYRWYGRYRTGGPRALEDRSPRPKQVWNRIADGIRERIVQLALDEPELSPRELATRFTDSEDYFVSEASVYRLLKAHDLIASPAFILVKAADAFTDKTTAPNQLWQTDFTYLKVIGWGWFYLSTVLDDFSRYIIAWKLCATMKAGDVTDTLQMALTASGCDTARALNGRGTPSSRAFAVNRSRRKWSRSDPSLSSTDCKASTHSRVSMGSTSPSLKSSIPRSPLQQSVRFLSAHLQCGLEELSMARSGS
jgi:putative transposase